MKFLEKISVCTIALRDILASRYHPERHYMRGPGPACRKRAHHQQRDHLIS
ncbi:MAG: hypothetical protein AB3N20_11210 [Rhizobiaceae bacterium]